MPTHAPGCCVHASGPRGVGRFLQYCTGVCTCLMPHLDYGNWRLSTCFAAPFLRSGRLGQGRGPSRWVVRASWLGVTVRKCLRFKLAPNTFAAPHFVSGHTTPHTISTRKTALRQAPPPQYSPLDVPEGTETVSWSPGGQTTARELANQRKLWRDTQGERVTKAPKHAD